ncbi:MAG: hypothetical protein ISR72_13560 [Methylobacter sp.]|nr:hypothetical protein [Methylobacter sp.]
MNQELSNSLNMDAALSDIQLLVEQSRQRVTSYVNSSLTLLYWHIGLRIQHELLIKGRTTYGNQILATLSQELTLLVPKLQLPSFPRGAWECSTGRAASCMWKSLCLTQGQQRTVRGAARLDCIPTRRVGTRRFRPIWLRTLVHFSLVTKLFMLLVPKLQLGNSVSEAPASRVAKLELRPLGYQAGAWEPAFEVTELAVNIARNFEELRV